MWKLSQSKCQWLLLHLVIASKWFTSNMLKWYQNRRNSDSNVFFSNKFSINLFYINPVVPCWRTQLSPLQLKQKEPCTSHTLKPTEKLCRLRFVKESRLFRDLGSSSLIFTNQKSYGLIRDKYEVAVFTHHPSNASHACSSSKAVQAKRLFLFPTPFFSQLLMSHLASFFPFAKRCFFFRVFPAHYIYHVSVSMGLYSVFTPNSSLCLVSCLSCIYCFILMRQKEIISSCCLILLNFRKEIFPVDGDLSLLPRGSVEEMHCRS